MKKDKTLAAHIFLLCLFRSPLFQNNYNPNSSFEQLGSDTSLSSMTVDFSLESAEVSPIFRKNSMAPHFDFEIGETSKFDFYSNFRIDTDFWMFILDHWRGGSSLSGSSGNGVLSDITSSNNLSSADIEAIQYSYKEDEVLHTGGRTYQPQTVELPCSSNNNTYKENFQFEYKYDNCQEHLFEKSFSVDAIEPSLKENVFLYEMDSFLATNESSENPDGQSNLEVLLCADPSDGLSANETLVPELQEASPFDLLEEELRCSENANQSYPQPTILNNVQQVFQNGQLNENTAGFWQHSEPELDADALQLLGLTESGEPIDSSLSNFAYGSEIGSDGSDGSQPVDSNSHVDHSQFTPSESETFIAQPIDQVQICNASSSSNHSYPKIPDPEPVEVVNSDHDIHSTLSASEDGSRRLALENRRQEDEVLALLAPRGITRDQIVSCSLEDFHRITNMVRDVDYSNVLKEMRKRGRNKLAARKVRTKVTSKLDETRAEVDSLKRKRDELARRSEELRRQITQQKQINQQLLQMMNYP